MNSLEIGLAMLAIVFSGAFLGMLLNRRLPSDHVSSDTKTAISVSTAVIGTMSALVIGLLISSASSSFSARNGAVSRLSADIIQLDGLLHRYGPEAAPVRQALQRYTAMKIVDLTPVGNNGISNMDSPASLRALEEVQDLILALKTTDNRQHWLIDQAMQLVADVGGARSLLIQQNESSIPLPVPDRVLADHPVRQLRPIRAKERHHDYCPIPLRIRGFCRSQGGLGYGHPLRGESPNVWLSTPSVH